MELKWLEDFVSLSTTANFSRSALERNMTQSALSRRIRQLEAWLGAPLVDRKSYPIRLTSEGEAFLPRAAQIIAMIDEARAAVEEARTRREGSLVFACLNTLSLTFFPTYVSRIEARLGPLKTRLSERRASFLDNIAVLVQGECDFMLTYAHPRVPIRLDPERFEFIEVGQEAVIPVSAPDGNRRPLHELREGAPIAYLGYSKSSFFNRMMAHLFEQRPLQLNQVYESTMSAGLKGMAAAGHGVAWIPVNMMQAELASGALVPAGGSEWSLVAEIRLYRARIRSRPAVERFWAAITEEVASSNQAQA